jgi:hypothetical protein
MATNKITKQDRQAFAAGVAQLQELSAEFEEKLAACRACAEACQLTEKSAAEAWQLFLPHLADIERARIRAERAARRAELCLKTAVVATIIYILFCFFGHGH